MGCATKVEDRDWTHAVHESAIVHEDRFEGGTHLDPSYVIAVRIFQGRRSTRDVLPIDQQGDDPIDAVAVHPFRGRQPPAVAFRNDPKLMHLDMPRRGGDTSRRVFEYAREC